MRPLFLGVTLVCLAACDETPAARPNPAELALKKRVDSERAERSAPPPTSAPEQPAPAPAAPKPAVRSHLRPRVGDFVEYELSYTSSWRGGRTTSATVRLQAIEVNETRTLVHVSSKPTTILGSGLVFELLEGGSARLEDDGGGVEERITISGREWTCRRTSGDASAVDGPKFTRCSGSRDEALALGDGMVELHLSVAGPADWSAQTIKLVHTGTDAALPPPAPFAFPKGTWWVEAFAGRVEVGSAEGLVVVQSGGTAYPRTLLDFVMTVLQMDERPPVPATAARSKLTIGAHTVEVYVLPEAPDGFDALLPRTKKQKATRTLVIAAEPQKLKAPLPVRFGILEYRFPGETRTRFTDWSETTP